MAPRKPTTKKRTYNKAKSARKTFKGKSPQYKSDFQSVMCSAYTKDATANGGAVPDTKWQKGNLKNLADIVAPAGLSLACSIALHPSNPLLATPTHAAYKGLFNEYRTTAIYLDMLLSKDLRESAQAIFMLVEKGQSSVITDITQMCSDVNHRMYRSGQNTDQIRFKHIFSSSNDKLWRKTAELEAEISADDLTYVKILIQGNPHVATVEAGDANIEMRVRLFNQYKDMKVLSNVSIPLN